MGGQSYTVQFNANRGIGTRADQLFDYNEEKALRTKAFSRYKYRLAGWSTMASEGTVQTSVVAVMDSCRLSTF